MVHSCNCSFSCFAPVYIPYCRSNFRLACYIGNSVTVTEFRDKLRARAIITWHFAAGPQARWQGACPKEGWTYGSRKITILQSLRGIVGLGTALALKPVSTLLAGRDRKRAELATHRPATTAE